MNRKMHGSLGFLIGFYLLSILAISAVAPKKLGKFIIDTDVGGDDALAILFALATEKLLLKNNEFEVIAITCTYGNTNITNVENNVLKVLTIANRSDIPVYSGAERPLLKNYTLDYYFGTDGFGDFDFDEKILGRVDRTKHASQAMIDLAHRYPGNVSIMAIGPLTNVALAMTLDSNFAKRIKKFYIMGSSVRGIGNVAPNAEFNFYQDPQSNFIVLDGLLGKPATLLPWEACLFAGISMEWRKEIFGAVDSRAVEYLNKIERKSLKGSDWIVADTLLSALTLWPELIIRNLTINVTPVFDGSAAGSVLVDYRNRTGSQANAFLIEAFDVEAFKETSEPERIGKLIIDTDAGGDDAVAILLALAAEKQVNGEGLRLQVIGITCTYGNTNVTNVGTNVLKLLTIANRGDVSLCDDYSLPVDFVNKRRPASAAAITSTVHWNLPSPSIENTEIEIIEQYSDPRDSRSKPYVEPTQIINETPGPALSDLYSKINRNYCRPYTDPSGSDSSCDGDEIRNQLASYRIRKSTNTSTKSINRSKNPEGNSLDREKKLSRDGAVTLDCVALVHVADQSPTESTQPVRHPSPYYYGDLFKVPEQLQRPQPNKYRKSISLDVPGERSRTPGLPKRNSVAGDGGAPYHSSNNLPGQSCQNQHQQHEVVSPTSGSEHALPTRTEILSSCIINEWDHTLMPPHRLLSHDLPTSVCTCLASPDEEEGLEGSSRRKVTRPHIRKLRRSRRIDPQPILVENDCDEEPENGEGEEDDRKEEEDQDEDEPGGDECADDEKEDDEEDPDFDDDEDMARQRHLYETAFDCKVSRSDDDLDALDRVTNHPVLHGQGRSSEVIAPLPRASSSTDSSNHQKSAKQSPHHYSGCGMTSASMSATKDHRRKVVLLRPKPIPSRLQHRQHQHPPESSMSSLSHEMDSLQVNSGDEKTCSPRLPHRGYTPSPPSTAPLPAKFHGGNKDHLLLNIRSAPNLPSQPDHPRLKDMRLPVKSLRAKESPQSSEAGSILEIKGRPKSSGYSQQDSGQESAQTRRNDKELILEFKGRPREELRQRPRSLIRESRPIMEFKGRPHEAETGLLEFKLRTNRRRVGYSSTESMATSSSGGSMESIRSSTSEGNRSTSSSESRHSTSLSSHSSDSGSNCFHHHHHHHHHHHQNQPPLTGFLTYHASKLHILSPISDKSSQEPASETSDNNRNNNSQKASPEENVATENVTNANTTISTTSNVVSPSFDTSFKKRRTPQNKNLINLALQSSSSGDAEIQGSDSGISIESRAGIKCKPFGFNLLKPQLDNINLADDEPELSDLPFDMPKLRRRRLLMQQDATTSGSATSVDLRNLPFDMPKLRRRLRCTQSNESSASQASSSLSVRDVDPPTLFGGGLARPKMTLNLDGGGNPGAGTVTGTSGVVGGQLIPKKPGGLSLGLPLEITTGRASADLVDVELPLERQGWYHGSITRIEAEAVLRLLREGSYLVRNSESTKQDYSLSLKSARGFMHMRIQRNEESNAYILGQFSKPFDGIPEMVRHFSVNRLPIRGAEHMCLLHPVIAQLL